MDFGLSEEQVLLQQTVRGFTSKECPTTRLRELFDVGSGHDQALWTAMVEMGITGLMVPEEHGGAGMELLDLALVAEVLGEAALPSAFLGHSLAVLGVMRGAGDADRARILPQLANGEAIGTIALQERRSRLATRRLDRPCERWPDFGRQGRRPTRAAFGLFPCRN